MCTYPTIRCAPSRTRLSSCFWRCAFRSLTFLRIAAWKELVAWAWNDFKTECMREYLPFLVYLVLPERQGSAYCKLELIYDWWTEFIPGSYFEYYRWVEARKDRLAATINRQLCCNGLTTNRLVVVCWVQCTYLGSMSVRALWKKSWLLTTTSSLDRRPSANNLVTALSYVRFVQRGFTGWTCLRCSKQLIGAVDLRRVSNEP